MSTVVVYKSNYEREDGTIYESFKAMCKGKAYKTQEDIKCYMPVRFVNKEAPQHSSKIELKDFLFGAYKRKEGFAAPQLVIFDYDIIEEYTDDGKPTATKTGEYGANTNTIDTPLTDVTDDEPLPF